MGIFRVVLVLLTRMQIGIDQWIFVSNIVLIAVWQTLGGLNPSIDHDSVKPFGFRKLALETEFGRE